MTKNDWACFSSMLSQEELDRIGISEDRNVHQCIVRLADEYNQKIKLPEWVDVLAEVASNFEKPYLYNGDYIIHVHSALTEYHKMKEKK